MAKLVPPFPSDPDFGTQEPYSAVLCRTRTRPEAQGIAQLHINGTIKDLFKPPEVKSFRRKPLKNHILENKRLTSQSTMRSKSAEAEKPKDSVKFSSKYDYIQPKVSSFMKPTHPRSAMQPSTSRCEASKNFLKLNKETASVPRIRVQPCTGSKPTTHVSSHSTAGKIPKYLLQRRKLWHKQKLEEEASMPDPTIPEGHTTMSHQDKLSTMKALDDSKRKLTEELLSLPIVCHTLKQKQVKADIELKLSEIDDAMKIFSRPKVFIKIDH